MGRAPFLITLCLLGCEPSAPSAPTTSIQSKTLSVPQTERATYFTSDGEVVTVNTGNSDLLNSIRYVVLNTTTPTGWVFLFDRVSNDVSFVPRERWLAMTFQNRSARWSGNIVAERARVMLEQHANSKAANGQKEKREVIGDGVVDVVSVDFLKRVRAVVWNQPTRPKGRHFQACAIVCQGCEPPSSQHRVIAPESDEANELRLFLGFNSPGFTVCGMNAETNVSRETKRE